MKNTNTITEAESLIKAILDKRESEIKYLKERIHENEKTIKGHEDDIASLTLNGDDDAYLKSKKAFNDAVELMELNKQRLKALEEKPLTSKEEQRKVINTILDDCNSKNEEAKKELSALALKMYKIGVNLNDRFNEAQHILMRYQHEICKTPDGYETLIDDRGAVDWGTHALLDYRELFERVTGIEVVPATFDNPFGTVKE